MSNDEEEGENDPFNQNILLLTQDKRVATSLYTADILGINVVIAIGKVNTLVLGTTYQFPIYLVTKNKQVFRIGNYNVDNKKAFDKEDKTLKSVKYLKTVEPTLFDFVTKEMIQRNGIIDYQEPSGASEDNPAELMVSKSASASASAPALASTAARNKANKTNAKVADHIGELFEYHGDQWIRDFMNNDSYEIIENEGGGDCLFATIRQAFESIDRGHDYTVRRLRETAKNNIPEDYFNLIRTFYDEMNATVRTNWALIDTKKQEYNRALVKVQTVFTTQAQQKLIQDADKNNNTIVKLQTKTVKTQNDLRQIKTNKTEYKEKCWALQRTILNGTDVANFNNVIAGEREMIALKLNPRHKKEDYVNLQNRNNILQDIFYDALDYDDKIKINDVHKLLDAQRVYVETIYEAVETNEQSKQYDFVKDYETFDDFQQFMLTKDYWADDRCINVLENVENIKFIIFSKIEYNLGRTNAVIQCVTAEMPPDYNPDYYILVEHTGQHYRLICYNEKKIFTFNDLPQGVKIQIVQYCMQTQNDGPFSQISDFKEFKIAYDQRIAPNAPNAPKAKKAKKAK